VELCACQGTEQGGVQRETSVRIGYSRNCLHELCCPKCSRPIFIHINASRVL
jgi:hypothetical protein